MAITPAFSAVEICPADGAQPLTFIIAEGLDGDVEPYLLLDDIPELDPLLRQKADIQVVWCQLSILLVRGISLQDE